MKAINIEVCDHISYSDLFLIFNKYKAWATSR